MQMATISRWTPAYFGTALLALILGLGMMAAGWGYPQESLVAPGSLILVHLFAIGWLSLLMFGALFQFLPVLVGRELAWQQLTPMALGVLVAGLLLMLVGFAALDGGAGAELLPLGGFVVIGGFVLAGVVLFATLLRAETLPLPAGFVAVALMSALVATFLGDTLALALTGLIGGDFAVALVSHGVALHVGFGLGGWLTLAAMGVSYRLVSMFVIAPEQRGWRPKLALAGAGLALALLCAALGVLIALNAPWQAGLAVAGLAGLVVVGFYLADMVALFHTRRRRALELHVASAAVAMAMLGLGASMMAWAVAEHSEAGIVAAVYVLALGWLSGLGLSMLYKIIPFLTWLECFAPSMGRVATPRVQDLVREERARSWFRLYFAAVPLGGAAIIGGVPPLLQLAAGLQLLAVLLLIHQFYRARQLADLPEPLRGHGAPRLFLPAPRPRSLI